MTVLNPVWIDLELAEAIHERQIAEHGGGSGIRDKGMLESALAKPRQLQAYGGTEIDIPAMTAAYAYGIARNHAFVDGNKRTAAVVCELFLVLNGYVLLPDDATLYPVFLDLAAGHLAESELADWLRANTRTEKVSEPVAEYS